MSQLSNPRTAKGQPLRPSGRHEMPCRTRRASGRTMTLLHTKREQAASWYDARADALSSALGVMWRESARRIRNGDADHRLDRMIAEQAEFDGDGA